MYVLSILCVGVCCMTIIYTIHIYIYIYIYIASLVAPHPIISLNNLNVKRPVFQVFSSQPGQPLCNPIAEALQLAAIWHKTHTHCSCVHI